MGERVGTAAGGWPLKRAPNSSIQQRHLCSGGVAAHPLLGRLVRHGGHARGGEQLQGGLRVSERGSSSGRAVERVLPNGREQQQQAPPSATCTSSSHPRQERTACSAFALSCSVARGRHSSVSSWSSASNGSRKACAWGEERGACVRVVGGGIRRASQKAASRHGRQGGMAKAASFSPLPINSCSPPSGSRRCLPGLGGSDRKDPRQRPPRRACSGPPASTRPQQHTFSQPGRMSACLPAARPPALPPSSRPPQQAPARPWPAHAGRAPRRSAGSGSRGMRPRRLRESRVREGRKGGALVSLRRPGPGRPREALLSALPPSLNSPKQPEAARHSPAKKAAAITPSFSSRPASSAAVTFATTCRKMRGSEGV